MDYKALIESALTSTSVPLAFQHYSGTATQYITYFCYNEQGEEWAENKEISTGFYLQIDVWSKARDYEGLVTTVKTALKTAGFEGCTAQDLKELDTSGSVTMYHKAIRVNYITDTE